MSVTDPANSGLLLHGNIPHEVRETVLLMALSRSFRVALDVGAHIGWYTCLLSQSMGDGGIVHAFEPNPFTYRYLQANTSKFAAVSRHQLAISDREEVITFFCAQSSNLSSSSRPVGKPVAVSSLSLDQFAEAHDLLGKIDFVKCDVEGGEAAVLRGSRRIRSAARPPIWMMEIDEQFLAEAHESLDDLKAMLQGLNGESVRRFRAGPSGDAEELTEASDDRDTRNVFLVPESRLEDFRQALAVRDAA